MMTKLFFALMISQPALSHALLDRNPPGDFRYLYISAGPYLERYNCQKALTLPSPSDCRKRNVERVKTNAVLLSMINVMRFELKSYETNAASLSANVLIIDTKIAVLFQTEPPTKLENAEVLAREIESKQNAVSRVQLAVTELKIQLDAIQVRLNQNASQGQSRSDDLRLQFLDLFKRYNALKIDLVPRPISFSLS